MSKRTALFPHISRIFSASTLWIALFSLFSLNIYAGLNWQQSSWQHIVTVLTSPSSQTYMQLAQNYKTIGNAHAAFAQLALAKQSQTDTDVLGVSNQARNLELTWANEAETIRQTYEKILQFVATRPQYRDGYTHLSALGYVLGNDEAAQEYIDKALALDPNNALSQKLADLIQREGK